MPEQRHRGALRKLALFLVAATVAAVLAELAVARWFPVGSCIYELDAELIYRTIPRARNVLVMDPPSGRRFVPLRLDGAGHRGPGPDRRASVRVALYGDSFVIAENVRFRDTFGEQLEAWLAEQLGRRVEVVNAGASGYGPDQSFRRMVRELDALDADLVVLVLCASNDFGDLVRNKMYRLDERGELVDNEFAIDASVVARFEALAERASDLALVRLYRASRAPAPVAGSAPAYIDEYLRAATGHFEQYVEQRQNNVYTLFQDYYEADMAIYPDWPSSTYKRALMGALLRRVAQWVDSRGLPLFAVSVPSAVDLDETFAIRVDPKLYPTYDPERLGRTLAELLAQARVAHVDLGPAFRAAGAARLFEGGDDIHWNAAGQALAATHVGEAILAAGLLER